MTEAETQYDASPLMPLSVGFTIFEDPGHDPYNHIGKLLCTCVPIRFHGIWFHTKHCVRALYNDYTAIYE